MELVLLESWLLLLMYGRECSRIGVSLCEEEQIIQNNEEMPVGGGAQGEEQGGALLRKSSELSQRERGHRTRSPDATQLTPGARTMSV